MGTEKIFENKVKAYLKSQGCWFVKYWSGNSQNGMKFTRDGIPDLLVCCNGYFLGIELKSETGKVSELQQWHLDKICEAGGIGIVLRPHQFEEFKDFVKNKLMRRIYRKEEET